jgi:hypothetical protein
MEKQTYDKRSWRKLPREECVIAELFGDTLGGCKGEIHRHHTDPLDPESRSVEVCNSHHQYLHVALRAISAVAEPRSEWRTCNHAHTYPWAKEACERRLNRSG